MEFEEALMEILEKEIVFNRLEAGNLFYNSGHHLIRRLLRLGKLHDS